MYDVLDTMAPTTTVPTISDIMVALIILKEWRRKSLKVKSSLWVCGTDRK